jgi:sporulation integral membrane protein YlbJ
LCSRIEAERLISFTNTADPIFMIGAVAVGMFHRADLGIIIAGAHYISSIIIGLIMRFYRGSETEKDYLPAHKKNKKNIFSYALIELIEARKNDGRTLGELLGDSVRESIETLLMVGGFIILFSVITEIFIVTGLIDALSGVLIYILQPLGLTRAVVLPMVSGFFEITNGTNLASQAQAPLLHQVIIANAVIAWSGLSVFAQVATMINGTDIKLKPYVFARILQSILAGIITVILFIPYNRSTQPTFLPVMEQMQLPDGILLTIIVLIIILGLSFSLSFIIYYIQKIFHLYR